MAVNIASIISLGQNVAFLLCLPLLNHFVCRLFKKAPPLLLNLIIGLTFALIAIIGMLSPLNLGNGIIIDGRIAIIALAAVYSTPTGILAALLVAAYRFSLGGAGAGPSIFVILTATLIGILWRKYFKVRLNQYQPGKLLVVGILLVLENAFWAYVSPFPQNWTSFQANILPIAIWFPTEIVLLGNLLAQEFIRQEMEDELRAGKARYLSIVNEQIDLVVRWKPDGTLTFVNQAFSQFFGKTPSELVGSNGLLLIDNRLQKGSQQMLTAFTPQQPIRVSIDQLPDANGDMHWLEWTNHAFFDERGHLIEIQSMAHDTTERKKTENRLRYQTEFQRLLIALALGFINFPVDELDSAISNALKEIGLFLGAKRAVINLVNSDETLYTRVYEWLSSGSEPLLNVTESIPDPDILLVKLRRGEDVILPDIDLEDEYPDVKQLGAKLKVKAMTSIPIMRPDQFLGAVSLTWEHPTYLPPESASLIRMVSEIYVNAIDRKRTEQEIRQLNADLEQRVVARTAQLLEANQKLEQEIIERREVENALRLSESQFRYMLDSSSMGLFIITEENDILYTNPVAAALLGIDQTRLGEYKGGEFNIFKKERESLWEKYHEQGTLRDIEIQYHPTPDDLRWGLFSARPVKWMNRAAIIISLIDVTDLKLAQKAEREQRALADALLDSAITITGTLELDKVLHSILSNLEHVVSHDLSNILVLEDGQCILAGQQQYIDGVAHFEALATVIDASMSPDIQEMTQTQQPVILSDIQGKERLAWLGSGSAMRSYLGLPIVAGQQVIGIISLFSTSANAFMPVHANYLRIFALQAGVAIQNARLYRQAHAIATYEERQRLARELHDSVSQMLFSASALAESLPRILERHPEKVVSYLKNLNQFTRGAMAEMRALLIELRPEALIKTDLGTLLRQLCDIFTGKTQIEVETEISTNTLLPHAIQVAYYRIAQETLNNSAKHAHATEVSLQLQLLDDGMLEMRIKDNGTGFDTHHVSGDHFGLQIIQERAAAVDAECLIISQPGQGSEIILRRNIHGEPVWSENTNSGGLGL